MEIIKLMITNVKDSNGQITLDEGNISFEKQSLKDDYEVAIKPIRILIDEKNKSTKQNFINELLSDPEVWGTKLYEYVKENRHDIATDHITFISELDVDRIVELMGDLPRIELFARQHADGWDCWGNEV